MPEADKGRRWAGPWSSGESCLAGPGAGHTPLQSEAWAQQSWAPPFSLSTPGTTASWCVCSTAPPLPARCRAAPERLRLQSAGRESSVLLSFREVTRLWADQGTTL